MWALRHSFSSARKTRRHHIWDIGQRFLWRRLGQATLTLCWTAGPHLGSWEGKAGGSDWGGKGNKRERCGDRCGLSPYGEQTWSPRSSAPGSVLEDGILRTSRLQSSSEANGSMFCSTGASGEECRGGSQPSFRGQGGRAGSCSLYLCFRNTQQRDDYLYSEAEPYSWRLLSYSSFFSMNRAGKGWHPAGSGPPTWTSFSKGSHIKAARCLLRGWMVPSGMSAPISEWTSLSKPSSCPEHLGCVWS